MCDIPKELRYEHSGLLNIENYNPDVYKCEKCNEDQKEYYYKNGLLGFCNAPFARGVNGSYAHVWECQKCFSVWWHHVTWMQIRMSITEREMEE